MNAVRDYIWRRVGPIFEEAVKDLPYRPSHRFAWRPNNYRLRFDFTTSPNKALILNGAEGEYRVVTSRKGVSFLNKEEKVQFQIGTNCLVAIWNQRRAGVKTWYTVEGATPSEVAERTVAMAEAVRAVMELAAKECLASLEAAATPPRWVHYEDAWKGEEYIDSLPPALEFHAEGAKKVYKDTVEFTKTATHPTPGVAAATYITNRLREDYLGEELTKKADALTQQHQAQLLAIGEALKVSAQQQTLTIGFLNTLIDLQKPKEQKIEPEPFIRPEYIG